MSIIEFTKKYRIEAIAKVVGWGAEVQYVLFDKEKNERVCHTGDVYGQFLKFATAEEALLWAEEHYKEEVK